MDIAKYKYTKNTNPVVIIDSQQRITQLWADNITYEKMLRVKDMKAQHNVTDYLLDYNRYVERCTFEEVDSLGYEKWLEDAEMWDRLEH